jgi:hypothetical protein
MARLYQEVVRKTSCEILRLRALSFTAIILMRLPAYCVSKAHESEGKLDFVYRLLPSKHSCQQTEWRDNAYVGKALYEFSIASK